MAFSLGIIILTYNEEKHISRCIANAQKITDKIFVFDSFSTDDTINILRDAKVRFAQSKFIDYGNQLEKAVQEFPFDCDLILRLDADEYMDDELIHALKITELNLNGYQIKRTFKYRDTEIEIPFYLPQKVLRIFNPRQFNILRAEMDEKIVVSGHVGTLNGQIIDHNINGHSSWLQKHRKYAYLEAKVAIDVPEGRYGKKMFYYKLPYFIRGFLFFIVFFLLTFFRKNNFQNVNFIFWQILWYRTLVDYKIIKLRFCRLANKKL